MVQKGLADVNGIIQVTVSLGLETALSKPNARLRHNRLDSENCQG